MYFIAWYLARDYFLLWWDPVISTFKKAFQMKSPDDF